MAVHFVARKCTQCAGKLQYIKEKKIWKCLYCGAEIERQEQYDGLFTVKNVVRQSLMDSAYRRMDSAAENLAECEKIDARYVGSVIARLAYDMIRIVTPGACDAREERAVLSELKRTYDRLREIGEEITDDEEALYEFLEASDIFAVLVPMYDSLGDSGRRDFVMQMLDPAEVFSRPAGNSLLGYALKNGQIDLANKLLCNPDGFDARTALAAVLREYPDGEKKGERAAALLALDGIEYEDRGIVESYLKETKDLVSTRCAVCQKALERGMTFDTDLLLGRVVKDADEGGKAAVLDALCAGALGDEDGLKILAYAFTCGKRDTAANVMGCLKRGGKFLPIPGRLLLSLLENGSPAEDRLALFELALAFPVDGKALASVLSSYLCDVADPPEDRRKILAFLLERTENIPTAAVERYVLQCTLDGRDKPAVVGMLFSDRLNISLFGALLSKYMNSGADPKEVRAAVVEVLAGRGLKIEPGHFVEYVCGEADPLPEKMRFISKMLKNGSHLRADAACSYLERTPPERFSAELFSMIFLPGSGFTGLAAEKYLLYCRDRDAVRVNNVRTVLDRTPGNALYAMHDITHLGNRIGCNLLQAYVLVTGDPLAVAREIVAFLLEEKKLKLNAEIIVSGREMKMKKYVAACREELSKTTNALCEEYKVYSMLF